MCDCKYVAGVCVYANMWFVCVCKNIWMVCVCVQICGGCFGGCANMWFVCVCVQKCGWCACVCKYVGDVNVQNIKYSGHQVKPYQSEFDYINCIIPTRGVFLGMGG